jgi:hypothetical protein
VQSKTTRVLDLLLLLLAFFLPFEIIHPRLVLPWFEFTNLEVLAIVTAGMWLLLILQRCATELRSSAQWQTLASKALAASFQPLFWLPVLFLALSLLSSVVAPAHRLDALKFDTRLTLGIAVFWTLIDQVRTRALLRSLLWALVLGCGISALVGVGEAMAWSPLAPLLGLFKEAPTRIGSEVRVSATFQYATMAAIFFEMVVPIAIGVAATVQTFQRRLFAYLVTLLGTANVVLTFSRAGLTVLFIVLAAILLSAWRQRCLRQLLPGALVACCTLLIVTGFLALQEETFRSRMVTENDLTWYGATYNVPSSLRLKAGEPTTVTVAIKNTGTLRWHASGENSFALAYYWLESSRQPLRQGHVELTLPQAVGPGESVTVTVVLQPTLPPGNYHLVWGMLQHHILWFRHRNIPEAHTSVHIERGSGRPNFLPDTPPETATELPGGDTPARPPTVPRLDLWSAAVRMWIERPLLGIGPDNFRHLYGTYLNLSDWDRRLHANNLYLELLVGWGIAGALVFAALMGVIARRWLHLWRTATGAAAIWALALGGSFLAFFLHGFLDYFLEFVPLYLLFWTVCALIVVLDSLTHEFGIQR